MEWFKNDNKYEMMVEDPHTSAIYSIAEVYYDEEEQTWAWVDTTVDVGYYGFDTPEEAQLDCEQSVCYEPEIDYDI